MDGDIDLVISNHSNESNRVFINNLATGNYLLVRLEGTNSNRTAIGARIYVNAIIDGINTTIMREVMGQTGGGPGSQSTLNQHFGLGDATNIISVEVQWPSGYSQTLSNVSTNQFIDIKEDDGAKVSGYVYHDENDNCIKDPGEPALNNTMISVNAGSVYAIEASPDVTAWNEIGSVSNATGQVDFIDPGSGTNAFQFYRARVR